MNTLKKVPRPLLQFIHSLSLKVTVVSHYTKKLMKYDDYYQIVRISRKEFNKQMMQVCLFMYE